MDSVGKVMQIMVKFNYQANIRYVNSETQEIGFRMYNYFSFECQLDEENNIFRCRRMINERMFFDELLGRKLFSNGDEKSIVEILNLIDRYCRLSLPDKFLAEYYRQSMLDYFEDDD